MQYPQIQFYRGSLVRLASGQLKQVEDLSSDDFIESARLVAKSTFISNDGQNQLTSSQANNFNNRNGTSSLTSSSITNHQYRELHRSRFNFNLATTQGRSNNFGRDVGGSSGTLDENNNSVFNSPEPTSASYDDSPRMETEDYDDEDVDVELDVVNNDDQDQVDHRSNSSNERIGLDLSNSQNVKGVQQVSEMVNRSATMSKQQIFFNNQFTNNHDDGLNIDPHGDFYIDSGVVRDCLEVGPYQQQQQQQQRLMSSNNQLPQFQSPTNNQVGQHFLHSLPSTSANSSPSSSVHHPSISPPVIMSQITTSDSAALQTVLIKFFLEASRSIAFIEVPVEHPFFVLNHGWSSWDPHMTFDTFGLKCRKLKIGDTCISLIRRKKQTANSHNESDQCNRLFSSIKINE